MDSISAREAAEKWGVNIRVVQNYCQAARIPGAKKCGVSWLIPADAPKPPDPRKARKAPEEPPSTYRFLTALPLPRNAPDTAFYGVEAKLRPLAVADLAFRRGDPEPAKAVWRSVAPEDELWLSAASLATAAAISSGDYPLHNEIQCALNKRIAATAKERDRALLSLPGTLAAVSMAATGMTPEWLSLCDFSLFPLELRPFLLFLHAMYLRNTGAYAAALATGQATLALCQRENSFTWLDVYLHVLCAAAAYALEEEAQSARYLTAALELAAPYGIIAPFADYLGDLGGTMELLMERKCPEFVKPTTALWNGSFKNWMGFHNAYTKDHITTILNPREYQSACLIARGATYVDTAKRMGLSVSRVKHILADVYAKLCIPGKRELPPFIL